MTDTGKHVPGAGQAALERGLKGLASIDKTLWQDSCVFVLGGEHSVVVGHPPFVGRLLPEEAVKFA